MADSTGLSLLQPLLQANAANSAAAPNAVWASIRRVSLGKLIAARIDLPTSMERCALPQWRRPMVTCARLVLISSATFLTQSPTLKREDPMRQSAEPSLKTTLMENMSPRNLVLSIQTKACVPMDAKNMKMITSALGLGPKVNLNSLMPRQCSAALLRASEA